MGREVQSFNEAFTELQHWRRKHIESSEMYNRKFD